MSYNTERTYLRTIKRQQQYLGSDNQDAYPLAFSELVIYIVTKSNSEAPIVFQLADMINPYRQRLGQLGVETPDVNSTRLKDKLPSTHAGKRCASGFPEGHRLGIMASVRPQ